MRIIKFPLSPGLNKILLTVDLNLRLVYLDNQDNKIQGWFEETKNPTYSSTQSLDIYLALTGEHVQDDYEYLQSHQVSASGGWFVVHAFKVPNA